MSKASLSPTSGSSLSSRRRVSTFDLGHLERLARGALFDLSTLAPTLAQQDGGRGVAVGDGFDIHGNNDTLLFPF